MRPQKPLPRQTAEYLEKLLAASDSDAERRRIECVYLRAKYGYDAERIAQETGLKLQTVRNIHSAYLKDGEACLKLSGKGGRKNFHLDLAAEATFLVNFAEEAKSDGVMASRVHAVYQKKTGKNTALTTVYRLLHRHGWRKIACRPGFWFPPSK